MKVGSIQEWKINVLDSACPVLVHFHTEWSAASNALKESLRTEHLNRFFNVVEVDADELDVITKILEINAAPTLFLISKGKMVRKLEGEIKKKQVKSLFYEVKVLSGEWSEIDLAGRLINDAYELFEGKDYDQAIDTYKSALKIEKARGQYEFSIIIALVKCNFLRGDYESAEFFVNELVKRHQSSLAVNGEVMNEIQEILNKIGDKRENSKYLMYKADIEDANKSIFYDPFNEEKHAKLAMIHYDYGFIEEAIEKALQVIESEGHINGFGYKVLMEIYKDLGHDNVYVQKYKSRVDLMHKKFRKT